MGKERDKLGEKGFDWEMKEENMGEGIGQKREGEIRGKGFDWERKE